MALKSVDRTRRLFEILATVRRYGLGELAGDAAPRWLVGAKKDHDAPVAERLRLALEELGPVFIKFGQMLSTRRDLLPPGMAEELSRLQDDVPPFKGAKARELIEAAYGHSLDKFFAEFDEEPMAAASIAQVHAARLHPQGDEKGEQTQGAEVVVKVSGEVEVDQVLLHVANGRNVPYDAVALKKTSGGNWRGELPAVKKGRQYWYVEARAKETGRAVFHPRKAESGPNIRKAKK